jgi:hypothetical protein
MDAIAIDQIAGINSAGQFVVAIPGRQHTLTAGWTARIGLAKRAAGTGFGSVFAVTGRLVARIQRAAITVVAGLGYADALAGHAITKIDSTGVVIVAIHRDIVAESLNALIGSTEIRVVALLLLVDGASPATRGHVENTPASSRIASVLGADVLVITNDFGMNAKS